MQVAVISADLWRRRGLADAIGELGGVLEVAYAAARPERAGEVDVVVVDIDTPGRWDRLGGLDGVAGGHVGAQVLGVSTLARHPVVTLRALESGVDALVAWDELRTLAQLEQLILAPSRRQHPGERLDHPALRTWGLSASSRPAACLAWVVERGVTEVFAEHGAPLLPRRRLITIRESLSRIGGITPVAPDRGTRTVRTPSWRQVHEVVALARGAGSQGGHCGR